MARAIYDEVVSSGHDAQLKDVVGITAADLAEFDLVFLGSACHSADLAMPVLEILSNSRDLVLADVVGVGGQMLDVAEVTGPS